MRKEIKFKLRHWHLCHYYFDYGQSGWEGHRIIVAKNEQKAMEYYIKEVFRREKDSILGARFSGIEQGREVWVIDYKNQGYDILAVY
jgi:hypothetical protein